MPNSETESNSKNGELQWYERLGAYRNPNKTEKHFREVK
jgi:hypothetical protein